MVSEKIKERQSELIDLVSGFCDDELNDEYKGLAIDLIGRMAEEEAFKRGKLEIWASAVIYALGQVNSLFDKSEELNKTPDDICDFFDTKKSTVSQKAKAIREMFDMDGSDEFAVEAGEAPASEEAGEEAEEEEEINEFSAADNFNYHSGFETLYEYEVAIEDFKKSKGEAYFEENKGSLWDSIEARQFMQDVGDYAVMLWSAGQKARAVDNLIYAIELDPRDELRLRTILINYLLGLDRLEDAERVMAVYSDYDANYMFSKLYLAIRGKADMETLKELYKDAIESNPFVIDYILRNKQIEELPQYYHYGEETEAINYRLLSDNIWRNKKVSKVLRKLAK